VERAAEAVAELDRPAINGGGGWLGAAVTEGERKGEAAVVSGAVPSWRSGGGGRARGGGKAGRRRGKPAAARGKEGVGHGWR
jgi:hypothetical protein